MFFFFQTQQLPITRILQSLISLSSSSCRYGIPLAQQPLSFRTEASEFEWTKKRTHRRAYFVSSFWTTQLNSFAYRKTLYHRRERKIVRRDSLLIQRGISAWKLSASRFIFYFSMQRNDFGRHAIWWDKNSNSLNQEALFMRIDIAALRLTFEFVISSLNGTDFFYSFLPRNMNDMAYSIWILNRSKFNCWHV